MISRDGSCTSLWQDSVPPYEAANPADAAAEYDVVIIGAGLGKAGISFGICDLWCRTSIRDFKTVYCCWVSNDTRKKNLSLDGMDVFSIHVGHSQSERRHWFRLCEYGSVRPLGAMDKEKGKKKRIRQENARLGMCLINANQWALLIGKTPLSYMDGEDEMTAYFCDELSAVGSLNPGVGRTHIAFAQAADVWSSSQWFKYQLRRGRNLSRPNWNNLHATTTPNVLEKLSLESQLQDD